jgi:uncharacterized Zn finger protein
MITYKCPKCKTPKELTEENFYKSERNATGYMYECRECVKQRRRTEKKRREDDLIMRNIF